MTDRDRAEEPRRHYAKRGSRVNLSDLLALLRALGTDGASLAELLAATERSRAAVMRLLADAGLLGVRIEWRAESGRYHVAEWGMLRRSRVLSGD